MPQPGNEAGELNAKRGVIMKAKDIEKLLRSRKNYFREFPKKKSKSIFRELGIREV